MKGRWNKQKPGILELQLFFSQISRGRFNWGCHKGGGKDSQIVMGPDALGAGGNKEGSVGKRGWLSGWTYIFFISHEKH